MLQELLAITQYPYLNQQPRRSLSNKFSTLFAAYGIFFLLVIVVAGPLIVGTDNFVVHVLHFKSIKDVDRAGLKDLLQKAGYVKGLLYICLIGPVLEETVFRLPLAFKRVPIAISIAVAVLLFGSALPVVKHLSLSFGVYTVLGARILLSLGIFFILSKVLPADIKLGKEQKKWLVITSMALFGLMHIANYIPLQWAVIFLYPIYVLPQLIMGWLITYVRFKNGFIWGIALHCLFNTLAMLLSFANPDPVVKAKQTRSISIPQKTPADTGKRLKAK